MGEYCSRCGEKRRVSHDFSVRHYLGEAIETFTHFDSKVLRTVWLLLSRPGLLSADYFAGRRIRYVSPLRLFLLLSVIYYLSNSVFPYNAFTTPLAVQLHLNDYYPSYAAAQVEKTLQRTGMHYAVLERGYNAKTAALSKTLVIALVPVFAVLFYVFLISKKRYFAEHLIVATHFWPFALLLIGVFIPVLLLALARLGALMGAAPELMTADSNPSIIIQVVFAAYLYVMVRRVYAVTRWYGGLLAVTVAWSFFHLVWLFRLLLFVVTLRSL